MLILKDKQLGVLPQAFSKNMQLIFSPVQGRTKLLGGVLWGGGRMGVPLAANSMQISIYNHFSCAVAGLYSS